MYETTDEYGLKSTLGRAAEDYLKSSLLLIPRYVYRLDDDKYHDGTY